MSDIKSSKTHKTSSDFEDVSSFSSVDSYQPEVFTGQNDQLAVPTPSRSESGTTLGHRNSNTIEKVVTHNAIQGNAETADSLKQEGLNLKSKAVPDVNGPMSSGAQGAQFPEEYRIETETGLVKLKTLTDLSRNDTRVSVGSNGKISKKSSGKKLADEEKDQEVDTGKSQEKAYRNAYNLEDAIEKNQHSIDKYQKHKHEKGLKGFVHRLFD